MSDPNVNATPESVADKLDGLDGNGNMETFLQVTQFASWTAPGPANFPQPESTGIITASLGDKVTSDSKVSLRLYKGLTWFDMIVAMYQAAGEPTPKAPTA